MRIKTQICIPKIRIHVFRCVLASLKEGLSVRRSIRPSVRPSVRKAFVKSGEMKHLDLYRKKYGETQLICLICAPASL